MVDLGPRSANTARPLASGRIPPEVFFGEVSDSAPPRWSSLSPQRSALFFGSSEGWEVFRRYPEAPIRTASCANSESGFMLRKINTCVWEQRFDLPARVQPIQQRHAYVGDDDVRFQLLRGLQQHATVADAAQHFKFRLQELPERCAECLVIVSN